MQKPLNLQVRPSIKSNSSFKEIRKHFELYMFMIPAFIVTFMYSYVPMYGILMAFQRVRLGMPFGAGEWIGFDNFVRLFNSGMFTVILKNTLVLGFSVILVSVPIPIILAIMMNSSSNKSLKKFTQTSTYLPYLLSMVVVISVINLFCNGEFGLINIVRDNLGLKKIAFFGETKWVLPLYVISAIWQSTGYNSVIFLAALSSVDESQVEASQIDGASKLQRIWYIDIPTIKGTIITMLILKLGHIMTATNVDKILLMQTNLNLMASETIPTYVYKTGIINAQYGFSTAVGLFNNVTNLVFLLVVNWASKKFMKSSIF